jgi:hypothetical protein
LGREGRDWYDKGRHVLGDAVAAHRMHLLTQIVRLLLTMIPDQRHISLKDEPVPYAAALPNLLSNAPLPE